MKMIKLMHVMPSLAIGGAEILLVNILKCMDRGQFMISVCCLFESLGSQLEYELEKIGIPIFFLGKKPGLDGRMVFRMSRILAHFRPDIIHTHNYVMRYSILSSLLNRIPVRIHTVHNVATREVDRIGRKVHWLGFNLFRVVPVSISECVASSIKAVYGKNSPVVYNGIFTDRFTGLKHPQKPSKEVVFVHIGNFRPQKNHFLLINGFAIAARRLKKLRLWMVGDGPMRAAAEKMVREYGLTNMVSFLGSRHDIPQILRRSDVYISTSKWEGFGLSIVEAMAAGMPVIATAVDGVPELVKHEESGILVKNEDADELADAIFRMAKDWRMIVKLGEVGRKIAISSFDVRSTTRKYEELYIKSIKATMHKNTHDANA